MANRKLIEQKVQQMIYGGDGYDAGTVFDVSEATMAKRMLGDYIRPNGDDEVMKRANKAVEQIDREYF